MNQIPNPKLIKPLLDYLNAKHPLSEGYIELLSNHVKPISVRKNKFILSPVDNNTYIFFIIHGLARGFIKDRNKEITTWFSVGNEFVGAIRNPAQGINPSIEYLQALDDCELLAVPYSIIDLLYSKFPEANIIGRKLLAIQYHAASERSILARIPSAQKRYERFVEISQVDLNRVPLRCIASYLGMRLETLSRLRNRSDQ